MARELLDSFTRHMGLTVVSARNGCKLCIDFEDSFEFAAFPRYAVFERLSVYSDCIEPTLNYIRTDPRLGFA